MTMFYNKKTKIRCSQTVTNLLYNLMIEETSEVDDIYKDVKQHADDFLDVIYEEAQN